MAFDVMVFESSSEISPGNKPVENRWSLSRARRDGRPLNGEMWLAPANRDQGGVARQAVCQGAAAIKATRIKPAD